MQRQNAFLNLNKQFSNQKTKTNMSNLTKKINIVGIGGVSKILANFPKNQNLFALDTNSKNLESLPNFIQKIQFGNGDGSGGNLEFAANLFDPNLVESIFDCDLLILIAGLGGGTGSGITPIISKIAKKKLILTKIIAFSPLNFEGSKAKSNQVLENFKNLDLPITLIDNQAILEKMSKETDFSEFWRIANFGANESIKAVKSIIESQNIDYEDLKKVFDYGGFCYTNSGIGTDFDKAFSNLENSTTLDENSFKTAKGFLLNFKIGKNGMNLEQLDKIQNFIKFVQSSTNANLKTSQETTENEEFEITVLVSGIGTQTKIDENYSKIIQDKFEFEQKKYLSQIRSESAKQNLSKK